MVFTSPALVLPDGHTNKPIIAKTGNSLAYVSASFCGEQHNNMCCWCIKKINTNYMKLDWILNNGHCANNDCFQNTVCNGRICTSGANTTNLFNHLKPPHPKENAKGLMTRDFGHSTAAETGLKQTTVIKVFERAMRKHVSIGRTSVMP